MITIEGVTYWTVRDIAAALDRPPLRVSGWRYRRVMPEPDVVIDTRRPLWRAETIEPWIERMRAGRLAEMEARYRHRRG